MKIEILYRMNFSDHLMEELKNTLFQVMTPTHDNWEKECDTLSTRLKHFGGRWIVVLSLGEMGASYRSHQSGISLIFHDIFPEVPWLKVEAMQLDDPQRWLPFALPALKHNTLVARAACKVLYQVNVSQDERAHMVILVHEAAEALQKQHNIDVSLLELADAVNEKLKREYGGRWIVIMAPRPVFAAYRSHRKALKVQLQDLPCLSYRTLFCDFFQVVLSVESAGPDNVYHLLEEIFGQIPQLPPDQCALLHNAFRTQKISAQQLSELDDKDLIELGISELGARKAFLKLATTKKLSESQTLQIQLQIQSKLQLHPSEPSIKLLSDIKILNTLGRGSFGTVFCGDWNGTRVALKTLQSEDLAAFQQELAIACALQHPHVLLLYGQTFVDSECYLVSEFMENGDLLSFVRSSAPIDEHIRLLFCDHTCKGMAYLHSEGVVHRDLACRNLLLSGISPNFVVKVADFGMSRALGGAEYYKASSRRMPFRWCAPEAIKFAKFDRATDVWSFGVVLFEIFSKGEIPYSEMENTDIISKLCEGYRLPPPALMPKPVAALMSQCWLHDPAARPTFLTALSHLHSTYPNIQPNLSLHTPNQNINTDTGYLY